MKKLDITIINTININIITSFIIISIIQELLHIFIY